MEICWPLLLGSWLIWLGSKCTTIHTASSSSNKRKMEYRLEITKSFLESNFPLHLPSSKKYMELSKKFEKVVFANCLDKQIRYLWPVYYFQPSGRRQSTGQ